MDMSEILKKIRTLSEHTLEECNMTAEGEMCPVHGMAECYETTAMEESPKAGMTPELAALMKKYGVGEEDMDEGNEFSGALAAAKASGADTFEVGGKTYHVKEHDQYDEGVHVDLDGQEAEEFLQRLTALAGSMSPGTEICPGCGHPVDQCTCPHSDPHAHDVTTNMGSTCQDCGMPMEECCCETMTNETADYDHGHVEHPAAGETVDQDEYMWKATTLPQRIVKGTLGDNPLIKEDAGSLFEKLSQDYESFLMEADLEHSNVGNESPLTATDRDEFEKDPLYNEEPVTDGSRSPLSRIERQNVLK